MAKKQLSIMMIAAGLIACATPAMAQESEETNPYGYDKSFITRPDYKKPTNPFAAQASDFHKHSYRRMLLNSPFASSSVGLGVQAQNKTFNNAAYDYLHPDSFKANDATPEEVNRYIDQMYKPEMNSSDNQGYAVDKNFDQPNPFKRNNSETRSTLTEENPFGSTFDNSPQSPFLQKGPVRKKLYYGQKDSDDVSSPLSSPVSESSTADSNF